MPITTYKTVSICFLDKPSQHKFTHKCLHSSAQVRKVFISEPMIFMRILSSNTSVLLPEGFIHRFLHISCATTYRLHRSQIGASRQVFCSISWRRQISRCHLQGNTKINMHFSWIHEKMNIIKTKKNIAFTSTRYPQTVLAKKLFLVEDEL